MTAPEFELREVPPGKVWLNEDDPTDCRLWAPAPPPPKKPGTVRAWVDGCFDLLHFGHTNAIRQAAALGVELFVGCHPDEDIWPVKGPTITTSEERYEALRACKWVTFVVENYPYEPRLKDIRRFEADVVSHGEDLVFNAHGRNNYQDIMDAGLFRLVKRTEGISTTDLVGRMLLASGVSDTEAAVATITAGAASGTWDQVRRVLEAEARRVREQRYLATGTKFAQFYGHNRLPTDKDVVVYVDGSFDLFHIGHVRVVREARKLGTFVIVGLHGDDDVRARKGKNFPIMSLHERALCALSYRDVDDIILNAPAVIDENLLSLFRIKVVVSGVKSLPEGGVAALPPNFRFLPDGRDPHALPKELGIWRVVETGSDLRTQSYIDRVAANHRAFLERQESKRKKDKKIKDEQPEVFETV